MSRGKYACAIEGCEKPARRARQGWCEMHYIRWYRHGDPGAVMRRGAKTTPLVARFWPKVARAGPEDCWEWTAYVGPNGRPRFQYNGRAVHAYRVAWELTHGPIPAGLEICHSCDNPICCNPAHLWIGTHAENMADMGRKGRGGGRGRRAVSGA